MYTYLTETANKINDFNDRFLFVRILVRLGELDAQTSNICSTSGNTLCTESQDFEIENVVHHPSYDNPKYSNDIALIRLRRKSNSSKTAASVSQAFS